MIGIHSALRFKTTCAKKDLGVILKKMNTETKELFGSLLETNDKRKKRLKFMQNDNEKKKLNNHVNQSKSEIKPVQTKGKSFLPSIMVLLFNFNVYFTVIQWELVDFPMVNDLKQNLNEEYYKNFTLSSETIVNATPKRDLPSVTNILNVSMSEKSRAALENWKISMIEKLGIDGFNKYSKGKIIGIDFLNRVS